MEAKLSTPQRSLITSVYVGKRGRGGEGGGEGREGETEEGTFFSLLGDEHEMQFWTTALYHMIKEKSRLQDPQYRVINLFIIYYYFIFY